MYSLYFIKKGDGFHSFISRPEFNLDLLPLKMSVITLLLNFIHSAALPLQHPPKYMKAPLMSFSLRGQLPPIQVTQSQTISCASSATNGVSNWTLYEQLWIN